MNLTTSSSVSGYTPQSPFNFIVRAGARLKSDRFLMRALSRPRSIDANASLDSANHHPRDGGQLAGKRRCSDETVVQGYARKLRVAQALQPSTKGR